MIARRNFLVTGLGGLAAASLLPRIAFAAAPTDKRFVFVIQRGAADGLHIVPPLGDPGFAALRGGFADALEGANKIDGTFSLHPSLGRVSQMFAQKQALAVHAVASVYRDRSHFDGQNVLETGGRMAYAEKVGWMNRLVGALPAGGNKALALAADIPMALRGPAPVSSYAPSYLPQAGDDLMARVSTLYSDDPQLSGLWHSAMATRALAGDASGSKGHNGADTGTVAAKLLAPADGARVMMIETTGWDTHTGQTGRLKTQLTQLDAMIGALADGLGPAWNDTLVLVATEFGRTAAINGTGGTDHGTASAALLMGGVLNGGGRVIADWPGLGQGALYQDRDLKPTTALEGVITGTVAKHFTLEPQRIARALYPDQPGVRPELA